MNIAKVIDCLVKIKYLSQLSAKELGLSDADLNELINRRFLKIRYFIAEKSSDDDNFIYLGDDDLHNRIITGELINPESGEAHDGEVYYEYENLFKIHCK